MRYLIYNISVILFFLKIGSAHQVWSWLSTPDSNGVLFNRYNWASVEQVCFPVSQGTTDVKICTSGAPGRKCIAMYASEDCTNESEAGVTWHEFSMYNTGGNVCNDINFDGTAWSTVLDIQLALMPLITGIEIAIAHDNTHQTGTTFPAFSVKTYNC